MDHAGPDQVPAADPAAPWAGLLDPSDTDTDGEAGEFRHAFRIGARWFLIPTGMPAEIFPPLPITRLPFTHGWCLGMASFRGEPAPVYDLGARLDEHRPGPGRYFLLLGPRDAGAALCIEEATGIRVPPEAATAPPPALPAPLADLARGSLALGAAHYNEIDLPALLGVLAAQAVLTKDVSHSA